MNPCRSHSPVLLLGSHPCRPSTGTTASFRINLVEVHPIAFSQHHASTISTVYKKREEGKSYLIDLLVELEPGALGQVMTCAAS